MARRRWRRAGPVALVALAGCWNPFAPDFLVWGRRPLEPVPDWYRAAYAEVEACWGRAGNFDRIRWWLADRIEKGPTKWANAIIDGDDITIRRGWEDVGLTVRHEMSHHVSGRGNEIHFFDRQGRMRIPCDGEA